MPFSHLVLPDKLRFNLFDGILWNLVRCRYLVGQLLLGDISTNEPFGHLPDTFFFELPTFAVAGKRRRAFRTLKKNEVNYYKSFLKILLNKVLLCTVFHCKIPPKKTDNYKWLSSSLENCLISQITISVGAHWLQGKSAKVKDLGYF